MPETNSTHQLELAQAELTAKINAAMSLIDSALSDFKKEARLAQLAPRAKMRFTRSKNIEILLANKLNTNAPLEAWGFIQSTELLQFLGVASPTRTDLLTAASFLRSINGNTFKRTRGKKVFLCPPVINGGL